MLANQVVRQVSWALAFLHQQQWVHRDIKPANLAVQGALVMKVPVKNQCSGEKKESQNLTKMREMIIGTRVLLSSHLAKTALVIWRLVIWSDWCIFVEDDLIADLPPNCDVRIYWGIQYKLQLHRWVKSLVWEEEPLASLGIESG